MNFIEPVGFYLMIICLELVGIFGLLWLLVRLGKSRMNAEVEKNILATHVQYLKAENEVLKSKSSVQVTLETEEIAHGRLWSKSYEILVKARLHINGIPTAGTFVICKQEVSELNDENIHFVISEIAKPLLQNVYKLTLLV